MKFGMQVRYGNTSGYFQGFLQILYLFDFCCFSKKQIEIFGPAYYLNDLSQLYETWCAALLWQYLGIFSRIFQKKYYFFAVFRKTDSNFWPHVPPKQFVAGL